MTAAVPLADGGARPAVPWTFSDARWFFTGTLVATGILVAAWWGASGTGRVGHQVGWVVVAIVGLLVSALSNAWWLASARQAVRQRAGELVARAERMGSVPTAVGVEESILVWVPRTRRYHRRSCLLAVGKAEAVAAPRAVHEKAGRVPCEVCQP